MIKVNEIKAQMRRQGITQAKLAGILKSVYIELENQ